MCLCDGNWSHFVELVLVQRTKQSKIEKCSQYKWNICLVNLLVSQIHSQIFSCKNVKKDAKIKRFLLVCFLVSLLFLFYFLLNWNKQRKIGGPTMPVRLHKIIKQVFSVHIKLHNFPRNIRKDKKNSNK